MAIRRLLPSTSQPLVILQSFRDSFFPYQGGQLVFEYEIPKYDGDLATPNVYVPLSRPQAEQKIETIMESFGSQHDKRWFTKDTFWATLRIRGIECHSESGLAEGLYCRKAQIAIG